MSIVFSGLCSNLPIPTLLAVNSKDLIGTPTVPVAGWCVSIDDSSCCFLDINNSVVGTTGVAFRGIAASTLTLVTIGSNIYVTTNKSENPITTATTTSLFVPLSDLITEVTITATPSTGYSVAFNGVTSHDNNIGKILMDGNNKTVSVTFTPIPPAVLTIITSGTYINVQTQGHVIVTAVTSSFMNLTGTKTITAYPQSGYIVVWDGVDTITGNIATVTMDYDRFVTASFETLQLVLITTGSLIYVTNSINSNPITTATTTGYSLSSILHNTSILITAVPTSNYMVTWEGVDSVSSNIAQVVMNKTKIVRITFTPL